MPILDHLNEEIIDIVEFNSFHHHWAAHIAEDLNKILPRGFRARAHAWIGVKEVAGRRDGETVAIRLGQRAAHPQPLGTLAWEDESGASGIDVHWDTARASGRNRRRKLSAFRLR